VYNPDKETASGPAAAGPEDNAQDSSQDSTLQWLLEMDMSEPEERLFSVEREEYTDVGLTDYELDVAGRPMTRGRAGADDLLNYVEEEIVISSENQSSDIYALDPSADRGRSEQEGLSSAGESMAIDYSSRRTGEELAPGVELEEGSDILGLTDDDDMGEKFLVIKRVKPAGVTLPTGEPVAPAPASTDAASGDAGSATAAGTDTEAAEQIMAALPGEPPQSVDITSPEAAGDEAVAKPVVNEAALFETGPGEAVSGPVETEASADDNVFDYIATTPPPVDEQDFDEYLRTGEALAGGDPDFDQLQIEHADGEQQYDPAHGDAIDFHEDFGDMASPDLTLVSAGAGSDPSAFSVFAEDLQADDSLAKAGDADWLPDAADIDAVFDDFSDSVDEVDATGIVDELAVPEEDDAPETIQVFEENIFNDDFVGELTASGEEPVTDIDALLDSLGEEAVDSGEICGLDVDEFSAARDPVDQEERITNQAATAAANPRVEAAEPVAGEPADGEAGPAHDQFSCIPAGIAFAHASPASADIFADFLDAFIEEGSVELEKLEDAIGEWERDIAADSAYAVVCRILHTIKGIAKGVGLHYYGTLIHNFETLLEAMPRPAAGAEADYFRVVNAWLDAAVRGVDHIQSHRADISSEFPQQAAVAAVPVEQDPVQATEPAPQRVVPTVSLSGDERQVEQAKKLADEGAKVLAAQQSVRITPEKLDHLLNLTNQAQQLGVRTAQSTVRGKRAAEEMQSRLGSVRAHIADIADRALRSVTASGSPADTELDALEMDQYTELQEAANILREGVEDLADLVEFASRQNAQIEAQLKQQAAVISNIGSSIRAARVVPVSRLVPGLRRLIRTVSVDLAKDVSFQVLNELGTLDRDDYARCQTILEHMVRNALDHGIEPAHERIAAGKPAAGMITIDIRKAGADAVITLTDDGRGIDPEAMRDSACRKGLEVDVNALTDDEAVRLIFHKGFSTASTVSQISGRGVGMDIVLSELQEMGGDIQIESTVGRGTAFHLRIPSSITVNGALLVTAGEQSYAIPLGGLIAVEQVPVEEFFAVLENQASFSLAGLECEPAYLATLCQSGHSLDAKTWRGTVPVLIAGSPERYMAIAVDDVKEALELVIRSLGSQFSSVPGVAGAATTADGVAVVALDLNLLVASVGTDDHSSIGVGGEGEDALLVMVVDDSRTQRMVATSQLETVGVETITAENGGVAIDLLNNADRLPDIILLDVEMPVKDGIQTLREIRKSVRYSHVPVIMVTSRTGLKHRALAQEAGCNGYMGKPFNFRMLVGQINELTGHRLQLS
jgi:chemotaxis protein histidine kinase CheA